MLKRFRRTFDTTAETSSQAECGPACACCLALAHGRAQELYDALPHWNSPLTPGVQLSNLSHSEDDATLRVDLGSDWPRMLTQLGSLGLGLILTRNEAAVLGARAFYPHPQGWEDQGADLELHLDRRGIGSARALHTRRESGHAFGVELYDFEGRAVHRFGLTPESDLMAFCDWVRLHQACSVDRCWEPIGYAPGVADQAAAGSEGLTGRTVRVSDQGAVLSLLTACSQRHLSVRATLYAGAVWQSTLLRPKSVEPLEDWWFAESHQSGLHFRPELFTRVVVGSRPTGDGVELSLRADTETCSPALLLEVGDSAQRQLWNELVARLC